MEKAVIVIVLYKKTFQESETIASLVKIQNSNRNILSQFEILIYDNGPICSEEKLNFEFEYFSCPENKGLNVAYNYALNIGNKKGSSWLLLLDHDTELNDNFLLKILENMKNTSPDIAAIVPKLINDSGKVISPFINKKFMEKDYMGKSFGITALNSGSLINIEFLNSIGGFCAEFSLDMLDYWLFLMIQRKKRYVYVINSIIKHDLSVLDYKNVSIKRYINIISSEIIFYTRFFDKKTIKKFRRKLFLRYLKQKYYLKHTEISKITYKKYRELKKY